VARIRSIKPEAFTSETLAALPVLVRWTFAGLWTFVDDDGRGKANAGLIKAAVWPLDDDVTPATVVAFLDALEDARLICRYEVDGKAYLHVVNFAEHQHPNRPVPSKLPACTRRTHGGLSAGSVSAHPKPSPGLSPGHGANLEASGSPEAPKSPVSAGQATLTEDAVSPHGAVKPNSFTMPPTPLRNELGEVDGDGEEVPPTAGAAKPRAQSRKQAKSAEPNPGPIVAAYVDGATGAGLPAPSASLKARVGRQARELLIEGKSVDALIAAAGHMGAVGWDDLARQVQRDAAGASPNGAPWQQGLHGHQPFRNPEDQSRYDTEEFRAP
jgi:hypothetical protein